jgi:hypothetical protein
MEPMFIALEGLLLKFQSEQDYCYSCLDDLAKALDDDFHEEQRAKNILSVELKKIADRIFQSNIDKTFSEIVFAGVLGGGEEHGKEENIDEFNRLSGLATSNTVRPDIWFKTHRDRTLQNIPVFLSEIVSGTGSNRSVKQTILKSVCNTVDLLRLYTNVFDSDAKVKEVSSIVFPKTRTKDEKKTCSAVRVDC